MSENKEVSKNNPVYNNDVSIAGRHYSRNGYFPAYDKDLDEVVYTPAKWSRPGVDDTFTGYPRTTAEKGPCSSKSIEENFDNAWIDYTDLMSDNDIVEIVRWKSNGAIPFGDMLLDFAEAGYITEEMLAASCVLKEEQTETFWAEYADDPKKATNNSFNNRVEYDAA